MKVLIELSAKMQEEHSNKNILAMIFLVFYLWPPTILHRKFGKIELNRVVSHIIEYFSSDRHHAKQQKSYM